jgi:hypothetical protein
MAVERKIAKPVGVTNESGEPEIVVTIEGLTFSMTPPPPAVKPVRADDDTDDD